MEPGRHHLWSFAHLISQHEPQLKPLLKRAVLRAAVLVPYPWLQRFPYPQAPPAQILITKQNQSNEFALRCSSTHIFAKTKNVGNFQHSASCCSIPIVPDASLPPQKVACALIHPPPQPQAEENIVREHTKSKPMRAIVLNMQNKNNQSIFPF